MMRNSCDQLEIDTKDICLLCLGSSTDINFLDSPSTLSLQGLKHLLRYLKVSPKELFNCSTEFLQSMEIREDIDLKIILCWGCSSVTEKFNQLYREYELIQLQFNDCVQSMYQLMSKGNENPERVRNYKDQMRPAKSADLVNASIAANLRNETLKKCSLKLQSETPRVSVSQNQIFNCDKDKCSKLPGASFSFSNNNQFREQEVSLGEEPRLFETAAEPQFDISKLHSNEPKTFPTATKNSRKSKPELRELAGNGNSLTDEPEICWIQDTSETIVETVTGDIEVTEALPVKNNVNRRKNYFTSLKSKLKTKSHLPATATTRVPRRRPNVVCSDVQICDYCGLKFSSKQWLSKHIAGAHPEDIISKLLPSDVSLELCKQGVHAVWKQMLKISASKCQFCMQKLGERGKLLRHLMGNHAEQFAVKVYENIYIIPGSEEDQSVTTPTDAGNNAEVNQSSVKTSLACEYCDCAYTSPLSLRHHKIYTHPEHIVSKFSPGVPLAACKQGVDFVMNQMKQPTGHGYTCKFCTKEIQRGPDFKVHVLSKHAKQVALETQQYIGLIPVHLEVVSTEALACSSTMRTHSSEDINESNELSVPVEMDFEEESLVKIENLLPEDVELDPLDVEYSVKYTLNPATKF